MSGGKGKRRLCVPVCARSVEELFDLIARAREVADFVELRFDCLAAEQLTVALDRLDALIERAGCPVVITFRPAEEGGRRSLDARERVQFWFALRERLSERDAGQEVYADVELGLFESPHGEEIRRLAGVAELICSQHDFEDVPADLESIYERMTATPARIFKLAARARDATDCLPLLKLLVRARGEGRELIAVAMGEAGAFLRVLGPSRGSFLTYASLDESGATAPGQLEAREMRRLYRAGEIDRRTAITGIVGSPVAHSLSPHMHNAALASRGMNGVYLPFEILNVGEFVSRMAHPRTREIEWHLRGFSVTAPHKREMVKHLDRTDRVAREIGAVNTVVVEGDELRGYNTDARAALAPLLGAVELRGARAAVIGAGGAARAVLWGLREAGAEACVYARDSLRGRAAADEFGARYEPLAGADFSAFDLVVNATPLGTKGHHEDESPAVAAQLRGARLAYDLVYNPEETRFLREARAAMCETLNGLEMLVAQAAEQFRLWHGGDAPVERMREAAKAALHEAARGRHRSSDGG